MAIYATKVWGFEMKRWGALGFSKEGVRNDLASLFQPDDFVLFVGTQGKETPSEMKGKLLGLVKIDTKQVHTRDLVEPELWKEHIESNGGHPKWPYGLPIVHAEQFEPFVSEYDLLPRLRPFARKMSVGFEKLEPNEERAVLALRRNTIAGIFKSDAVEDAERRHNLRKRLAGPMPSVGIREADYAEQPAKTYCMELFGTAVPHLVEGHRGKLERRKVYKIGWAIDPQERRKVLNAHCPDETCMRWEVINEHSCENQIEARTVEQAILKILESKKVLTRNEVAFCEPRDVTAAWISGVASPHDLK